MKKLKLCSLIFALTISLSGCFFTKKSLEEISAETTIKESQNNNALSDEKKSQKADFKDQEEKNKPKIPISEDQNSTPKTGEEENSEEGKKTVTDLEKPRFNSLENLSQEKLEKAGWKVNAFLLSDAPAILNEKYQKYSGAYFMIESAQAGVIEMAIYGSNADAEQNYKNIFQKSDFPFDIKKIDENFIQLIEKSENPGLTSFAQIKAIDNAIVLSSLHFPAAQNFSEEIKNQLIKLTDLAQNSIK